MDGLERLPVQGGLPLVHAVLGAAVPNPMLGAGHDALILQGLGVVQPQLGDALRVAAEALVGSAPLAVPHHRQHRREVPLQAGGEDFPSRGAGDVLHQLGVIGGA